MQNNAGSFKKFKKIPLLLSIIFLGASVFIFMFLHKQIEQNKVLAQKMQEDWLVEATRRNQIQSLDRMIKATENKRALLRSHFSQSTDIVPFLDTIQNLATSVGADSEIVSVDIVKEKGVALDVEVRATGSFEAVYKFITLLENSPYELDFNIVDLQNTSPTTTIEEQTTNANWSIRLKLRLLSFIL